MTVQYTEACSALVRPVIQCPFKPIFFKLFRPRPGLPNTFKDFNKTCRIKQLTPNYINIRVKGNNPKSERTKKSAIRYRINQELKFQYAKKQQLNEQLYKTHLECANLWPTTWQIIQTAIDSNIQSQMRDITPT